MQGTLWADGAKDCSRISKKTDRTHTRPQIIADARIVACTERPPPGTHSVQQVALTAVKMPVSVVRLMRAFRVRPRAFTHSITPQSLSR